jgi:hypothetical protein
MKNVCVFVLLLCISQTLKAERLPTSVYGIKLGDDVNQTKEKYEQCSEPIDELIEGMSSVVCEIDGEKVGIGYFENEQEIVLLQRFIKAEVEVVMEELTLKYGNPNATHDTGFGMQKYWKQEDTRLVVVDFTLFQPTTIVELANVSTLEARQKDTTQKALEVFK